MKTKGILVQVPEDQHKTLKLLAIERGQTLQAVVVAALDRLTNSKAVREIAERLSK